MTDKEKAAEYLRTIGYDAAEEDGIVIVRVAQIMDAKEFKKLEKKIEKIGYHESWGWRVANGE